jgi:hypothetical protein
MLNRIHIDPGNLPVLRLDSLPDRLKEIIVAAFRSTNLTIWE